MMPPTATHILHVDVQHVPLRVREPLAVRRVRRRLQPVEVPDKRDVERRRQRLPRLAGEALRRDEGQPDELVAADGLFEVGALAEAACCWVRGGRGRGGLRGGRGEGEVVGTEVVRASAARHMGVERRLYGRQCCLLLMM
jgi:hypothetical protein